MMYKTLEIINSIKKKLDNFRQLKPLEYDEIIKEYLVIMEEEWLKEPTIDIYLKEPKACVSFTMKEHDGYRCILYIKENGVRPKVKPRHFTFQIPISDLEREEYERLGNRYVPEMLYRENYIIKSTLNLLIDIGILEYDNLTFKFLCVESKPKLAMMI